MISVQAFHRFLKPSLGEFHGDILPEGEEIMYFSWSVVKIIL